VGGLRQNPHTRRHHIPRARYRVRNWPAYEAGLKRRGDLTLCIGAAALDEWQAPRRNTPGGQATYSDLAIEMVLMLRMVLHLALRQAEAFAGSALRLLGLDLCVPDHTTLSRRSGDFWPNSLFCLESCVGPFQLCPLSAKSGRFVRSGLLGARHRTDAGFT
jgi:Transposase DDE domain